MITASLVASSLIIGTAVSLYQMSAAVSALGEKDKALKEALAAKRDANTARLEIQQFSERMVEANVLTSSGQTHADAGRWSAANEAYTQAVTLQPKYYLPWVQRGQLYTRLSLWQEAAEDFAKGISLGAPTDLPQWYGVGALFAFTGDQHHLDELLDQEAARIVQDGENFNWQSLRNSLISQQSDSRFNWAQIANAAERHLSQPGPEPEMGKGRKPGGPGFPFDKPPEFRDGPDDGRRDEGHRYDGRRDEARRDHPHDQEGGPRRGGNMPRGVQFYVTGIAYFRAGDFENAVKRLRDASDDRGWVGQSLVHSPLAMALHALGQEELANQSLMDATEAVSEWNDYALSHEQTLPVPWFDYMEAIAFHREATRLITGSIPAPDDRLKRIRASSLQKLASSSP